MEQLLIENYNYPLPDERIAKYPLAQRDHSKLLVFSDAVASSAESPIREDHFYNIGRYLAPDSLLVYNNTRVIQARVIFHKESGARIEVFCLEPLRPRDYAQSLGATDGASGIVWKCMIGNLKKWKNGLLNLSVSSDKGNLVLHAERLSTTGNTHEVRFTWNLEHGTPETSGTPETLDPSSVSFAEILDLLGQLPIPPYLNRDTEESDLTTYQTVYSRIKGSVAAPTAGLHFTDAVLDGLREQGIRTTELTLHVGAGTFQPVKTADANEHVMHTEIISVPLQTIRDIRANLGHIVAVGTTSMRTLESLYFLGEMVSNFSSPDYTKESENIGGDLHVAQFAPYNHPLTLTSEQALDQLIAYLVSTGQDTLHAETQIMIRPGYAFHIVDQLITNFHQPKSTLLLLVSAFVGLDATGHENWKTIYDYALSHDFRFLSYGDSSILTRASERKTK